MGKDKASKDEVRQAREEMKHAKEEAKLAKQASSHDRLRRMSSDMDKTDDEMNPKRHRFKKAIAATVGAAKKLGKKKSRRERHNVIHIEEPPLSEHEKQQVSDFRSMLQEAELLPARYDDYHTLLRFIRARKHDLNAAKEMWTKYIQWRQEFGTDTIEKDFDFPELEPVKEHYPHGHHGVDRDGCPIYIELVGKVDAHKVLKHTTIERYLKYHVKEFERMFSTKFPAASIACGRHIETSTSIMDADGVGFKSLNKTARTLIQAIAAIDGQYYPETMKRMLIINAGPALRSIWSVVKGWIDPVTVKKITVLGTKYQSVLHEYIDPSQLPDFLGGTCHCENRGGCLMSDKGPWTDPTILQQLALQRAAHGRLSNGYGHRVLGSQGSDAFGQSTDDEETEDERSPQFRKEHSVFRQLSGMSRGDSNIPESGDEAQSEMLGPYLSTIRSVGAQSEASTPRDGPPITLIEAVAAPDYQRMVSPKPSNLKPLSPHKPPPLEVPGTSGHDAEEETGKPRDSEDLDARDSPMVKLKASSPWVSRRSLSQGRGKAVQNFSGRETGKAKEPRGDSAAEEVPKTGSLNPVSSLFLNLFLPTLASVWSFCIRWLPEITKSGQGTGLRAPEARQESEAVRVRERRAADNGQQRMADSQGQGDAEAGPSGGGLVDRIQSLEAQVRHLTVSLTHPNSPERHLSTPDRPEETTKKVETLELELETTKKEVRRLLSKQNELESLIKELPANRKFACF